MPWQKTSNYTASASDRTGIPVAIRNKKSWRPYSVTYSVRDSVSCNIYVFLHVWKGGNLLCARVASFNMCCWLAMSTATFGSISAYASWQVSGSQWARGLPTLHAWCVLPSERNVLFQRWLLSWDLAGMSEKICSNQRIAFLFPTGPIQVCYVHDFSICYYIISHIFDFSIHALTTSKSLLF